MLISYQKDIEPMLSTSVYQCRLIITHITQTDKDISSEALCIGCVKDRFSFCQYKLSIVNHLLSLSTVFKWKILTGVTDTHTIID